MKTSKQKQIFKIILFIPLFLLLLTNCSTDRKSEDENLLDKTKVYFENGEYDKALQTINEAIEPAIYRSAVTPISGRQYEEELSIYAQRISIDE